MICIFCEQMLADSLLACYTASVEAGSPLALEVFVSGRGRLEDEGATALAQAFKVSLFCYCNSNCSCCKKALLLLCSHI